MFTFSARPRSRSRRWRAHSARPWSAAAAADAMAAAQARALASSGQAYRGLSSSEAVERLSGDGQRVPGPVPRQVQLDLEPGQRQMMLISVPESGRA